MGTVRISNPEVGQCSGILIGPQRRDTETLARLSVLIPRSARNFRVAVIRPKPAVSARIGYYIVRTARNRVVPSTTR